jgi:hypothetical protein
MAESNLVTMADEQPMGVYTNHNHLQLKLHSPQVTKQRNTRGGACPAMVHQ